MLLLSVTAHVLVMTLVVLAPPSFWQRPAGMRSNPMMIDLGPTTGPRTRDITSIGPSEKLQAAAKTMLTVDDTAEESHSHTRNNASRTSSIRPGGAEVRQGNGGEIDAASPGMDVSTDVGTGGQVNVGDFCCPDYLGMMLQRIRQNWNARAGHSAVTTMKFTIERDGSISDVRLLRSSGNPMLDFLAERATLAVRQLPPLPEAYPHSSLTVSLDFQYQR